ncbi:8-demethyl-8-(2,3-dimethoxy-alpha-L-rhamnosyl)-tetracenomycin-C 4'-O-methyltransferase [Usitatibacter rugosus]|uniref:8-demethyl-8-(2, 3-dimethoxy-alpha-L-rhamnosyl)-tetracenomycin-C 4'-O-methyltransferase n=1 Tax=Usitatibacter rugosus TaxID=2732067 RepID=A0A6M4GXU0_9PROT|nr:TylF/MycF/NovP-related O-methyltransferase [Usitatibacter rugosus]QJR11708.1 8-demethyl-8-(2,3-dimethoxy-alpha-L-rhamnosyl)-tetracenomycin-C 4'-O-methyltransferase [Usitatibacter rugosus]
MSSELRDAYLDLMKKCLTRELFAKNYREIPTNTKTFAKRMRQVAVDGSRAVLGPAGLEIVSTRGPFGETMTHMDSLIHVQKCIEEIVKSETPGDFIETGVWRGGMAIFMKAVLKAHGDTDRNVWVADSFEGLPKPDAKKYKADAGDTLWSHSLDVSMDAVTENFRRYGVLDDRIRFLKGFFEDTIPTAPVDRLALLRLDGDMYGSTMVVLKNLYPKLSVGGYVIVDDYAVVPACKQAVHDYRAEAGIKEPICYFPQEPWDAHWRKES